GFRPFRPVCGRDERRDPEYLSAGATGGYQPRSGAVRNLRGRLPDCAGIPVLSEKDGTRGGGRPGSGNVAPAHSGGGGGPVFRGARQWSALDGLLTAEGQGAADRKRKIFPQTGEP